MNGDLTLVGDQDDDLKEVAGAVWADDQPAVGILAGVFHRERVLDGVDDVCILDAVPPGGVVDLHTQLSYYESRARCGAPTERTFP